MSSPEKSKRIVGGNQDPEALESAEKAAPQQDAADRRASTSMPARSWLQGGRLSLLAGLALCLSQGCLPATGIQQGLGHQALEWVPKMQLTLAQAEGILGEPAHLSESEAFVQNAIRTYASAYVANAPDQVSGKTGVIYFMLEAYPEPEAAAAAYTAIWQANQGHAGIEPLAQAGEQAYFHSDGQNFLFILARNRNMLVRLKVNKVTSRTSTSAFMSYSRQLANGL